MRTGVPGMARTTAASLGRSRRGWRPHETTAACQGSRMRAASEDGRLRGGRRRVDRIEDHEGAEHVGVVAPRRREAEQQRHRAAFSATERDRLGTSDAELPAAITANSLGARTTRRVSAGAGASSVSAAAADDARLALVAPALAHAAEPVARGAPRSARERGDRSERADDGGELRTARTIAERSSDRDQRVSRRIRSRPRGRSRGRRSCWWSRRAHRRGP